MLENTKIVIFPEIHFQRGFPGVSASGTLRATVVECLMLLVVTGSVDGDVKNAGMTRADAKDAKITAITLVRRILAVVF
ncbi:hypothetical protein BPOR_0384g00030 [Botrytis porri]|uniref:Uncharacterized protein n=1 Tax=Botrytis porri TaxID=87229 RepID=A0A4Z1KPD7_9HELO|nr:hypothetical protein BPOR_0384g00030 [Botrytis porri]